MPAPITLPDSFDADGLRLRPVRTGDVESVVDICRSDDVQRFTRVPSPYTDDDAREFVELSGRQMDDGTGIHLAVTEPGDDDCLGAVGVEFDWRDATGEVGYWLSPHARGRGLMTRAVRRVSRFTLGQLGLARLELRAATVNLSSNLVALRCAFRPEGRLRSATVLGPTGDRSAPRGDMFVYRLLPDDLDAPPAAAVPDDLAADGVRLRPFGTGDVCRLAEACDDPELVRWGLVGAEVDADAARERIVRGRQGLMAGDEPELAVVDAGTDDLLGAVEVDTTGHEDGVGELSYWTARWARGRGVATTAAGLGAAWAGRELDLDRVFLAIAAGNDASSRVAEKAGFTYEATLARRVRAGGRLRDAQVWVW